MQLRASALSREDHERFLPIVRRIAMRLARRVPREVTVQDLVSYGWIGLLEAHQRASGMHDGEFEAYASYRIRGAMLDYLRTLDPMARTTRAVSRRIARVIAERAHALGRMPEEDEIAGALGIDVDEYRAQLQRVSEAGMARLDIADVDELEHHTASTEELADKVMLKEVVARAIGQLSPRLQQVLALYYQQGCTLRQIGQVLGVTEARACQLHAEAMHKLRALVGKD
jgi:RNA polymerase sigma factor for flagellar operon FliA